MDKTVSVIIPVYNTGKYVEKCVFSILNQTYTRVEVIIVNDQSTDDSLEVINNIARTDARVKIIDIKHAGVSAARNAGMKEAEEEFRNIKSSRGFGDVAGASYSMNGFYEHDYNDCFDDFLLKKAAEIKESGLL